jgi:hypothetical protein
VGVFTKTKDVVEKASAVAGSLRPATLYKNALRGVSGSADIRSSQYTIFNPIWGFRGVKDGLGTSTLVANVALALAEAGLNVCVIDTSVLNPCQGQLLKAYYGEGDKYKGDWFDINRQTVGGDVVCISKFSPRISVLGFNNRSILDMVDTKDSLEMVSLALVELKKLNDIILLDICPETTNIALGALHGANKIVQVWGDSPHILGNVQGFLDTMVTLACPMDKLSDVVVGRSVRGVGADIGGVVEKYGFNLLGDIPSSVDLGERLKVSADLYTATAVKTDSDLQEYIDVVSSVCVRILGLEEKAEISIVKSDEIVEGGERQ